MTFTNSTFVKIMRYVLAPILIVLLAAVSLSYTEAQVNETCHANVEQALASIDSRCDGFSRNQACYVETALEADLVDSIAPDEFDEPADMTAINNILAVRARDTATGVVAMKVQANLPRTIPGQNVILVMVGNMEIENHGSPDAYAAEPVAVTALTAANLRSEPSPYAPVMDAVSAGEELIVDGVEGPDRRWLRVIQEDRVLWVFAQNTDLPLAVDQLPDLTASRASMQAFSISAGVGRSTCDEVPNSLLIQSPEGYPVTLNVNGSDVTIGSTIVFSMDGNTFRLAVLDGSATLPNGMVIQPGFHIDAVLNEDGSIGSWQGVRPMAEVEMQSFEVFETLDTGLVNYTVTVPDIQVVEAFIESLPANVQNENNATGNTNSENQGDAGDAASGSDNSGSNSSSASAGTNSSGNGNTTGNSTNDGEGNNSAGDNTGNSNSGGESSGDSSGGDTGGDSGDGDTGGGDSGGGDSGGGDSGGGDDGLNKHGCAGRGNSCNAPGQNK